MADCCTGEPGLMSWPEVAAHLLKAAAEWQRAGRPLLNGKPYNERTTICVNCPRQQYAHFQCRQCRCVVYIKAKLATEDCPYGLWPKL